jgi:hypothetical protein
MLRYEGCFPASEEESRKIERSFDGHFAVDAVWMAKVTAKSDAEACSRNAGARSHGE